MNALTSLISQVPAPAAYAILAAAVLAESVLLIGTFIPTLTLLLAAGALAHAGDLNLALVIAAASCAVVAGDALGHRTGHLLGSRLRTGRLGRRVPAAAWRRAEALMTARGGQAVLLFRFVPVMRTLAPHLAGATRLPYRRIAPYSLLSALLWAGAEASTGYAAATSLQHAMALGGPALAATAVLIAGTVLATAEIRRRRRTRARGGTAAVWWGGPPSYRCRRSRQRVRPIPGGSAARAGGNRSGRDRRTGQSRTQREDAQQAA
ncbi:DedA family protein [Streptomyces zaomyceticus]|uniref:DedA family protein n=1 Tax=Streptomyces zaomyceticus TaxID=68286 RepID=UPI0033A6CF60